MIFSLPFLFRFLSIHIWSKVQTDCTCNFQLEGGACLSSKHVQLDPNSKFHVGSRPEFGPFTCQWALEAHE